MSTTTEPMRPSKLLLDVAEVAELTALSRSHLYVEMGAGRLKYVKAGRRRLIRVADLEAYVAALSSQSLGSAPATR
jgi:excisionase family DNA binding protein